MKGDEINTSSFAEPVIFENHIYFQGQKSFKDGQNKEQNSMDLTEAEDIKTRWQEYTEELYKKDLNDPDNHNHVITHLDTDFLGCEVKWI